MGVLDNRRVRSLCDLSTAGRQHHAERNGRKMYLEDRWGLTEGVNLRRGLATIRTMVIMVRVTQHPAAALHCLRWRIYANTVKPIQSQCCGQCCQESTVSRLRHQ